MAILRYGPGGTASVSTDGGKTWTSGSYGQGANGQIINTSTGQAVSQSTPTSTTTSTTSKPAATSNAPTVTSSPTPTTTMAQQQIAAGGGNTGAGMVSGNSYNSSQSGWTNAGTGSTGKTYAVSNTNNAIQVQYSDGSVRTVTPGMADYNSTYQAMQSDLQSKGVNYVPTYTTTVHRDVNPDGSINYDSPSTFQTKNYTAGNAELQQALKDYAQTNPGSSLNDYVKNVYNTGGNEAAINDKLNGIGLSDFNSQNAIYTAGGNVLAGGDDIKNLGLGRWSEGDEGIMVNGSPQGGLYYTYGGQTYLVGGDAADYAQYVNGKVQRPVYLPDGETNMYGGTVALDENGNAIHQNNWTNADYILGGIQNNPLVQQDRDLYNSAMSYINSLNSTGGSGAGSGAGAGTAGGNVGAGGAGTNNYYTGNANVDNVINYINGAQNYAQATGDASALASIQSLLKGGYESLQAWIADQKKQAQQISNDQARAAWVNKEQNNAAMKEALSSAGLGTSGAVQSSMLGINNAYGNNLADINANLTKLLSNLDEQELKALTDYYNQMGDYAFRANESEADRALSREKLLQDRQQWAQDYALKQQQIANNIKQQELENQWRDQEYADKREQQQIANQLSAQNNDVKLILQEMNNLNNLFKAGKITQAQYNAGMADLGLA